MRGAGTAVTMLALAAASLCAQDREAFTWTAADALASKHIRIPSAGDGAVEIVDVYGRKVLRNRGEKSHYVYVDLKPPPPAGRLYVTVEYLDRGFGEIDLQYDSPRKPNGPRLPNYRRGDRRYGTVRLDSGAVRKAVFELHQPEFRGRQNNGADFRLLTGGKLLVLGVTVSARPPTDYAALQRKSIRQIPRMVPPAAGVEITFGGYDNYDVTATARWRKQLDENLPILRVLGATSHETYVTWRGSQPAPNRWDWSHYDACVAAHEAADLKWVPFLILGPSYSLPKWFYDSDEHAGYRCLAHDEETDIQSLWHPMLPGRVDAFLKAFATQYGRRGVIESVLLGITGNYGEAIYPVTDGTAKSWTSRPHGPYHSHPGMWCGDKYARADLRKWLKAKYGSIDKLNAAWRTKRADWDAVQPALRTPETATRAWLDTVDWYRGAMTDWAEFWIRTTRKHMPPGTEIYLCTGGSAPPYHGSEFGIQSKIAAKHGAGIRITNEASDYALNFAITRWVAAACRHYGTFFGYEPAGNVDAGGLVARIYNATCSGAKQLHHYPPNVLDAPGAMAKWKQYGRFMKLRQPRVKVAVWYPNRMVDMQDLGVLPRLGAMREVCDYDIVDARLIADGALKRYRILVCISDGPYEAETLKRVDAWVRGGGAMYLPGFPRGGVRSVEGDRSVASGWAKLDNVRRIATDTKLTQYTVALRRDLPARGVLVMNVPGVYATTFRDGSMLLLNVNDAAKDVTVAEKKITLAPVSITEIKSEGKRTP
jgi:hypothetical protein